MIEPHAPNERESGGSWRKAMFAAAVLLVVSAIYYLFFRDSLSLEAIAAREMQLREYQSKRGILVLAIAFVLYVAVTGLSLPGAAALSLVYGWFFGFWTAFVMVSFASTTGATIAFLTSRYFFRDAVLQNFGDRLEGFNAALAREGPFYLFALRLAVVVPFFVINAVMGLTRIPALTFWWISQLGMLPGTAVYIYAGSSVPSLEALANEGISAVLTPSQMTQLFVAFGLLGVMPLTVRAFLARLRTAD